MKLKLPAIKFWEKQNWFVVIDSLEGTCSALGAKHSPNSDAVLYDSQGILWKSLKANPEPSIKWYNRFLNSRYKYDLEVANPEKIEMTSFVEKLCKVVDSSNDNDILDQFISRDELKELFRSAKNPAELIHAAGNRGADLE